MPWEIARSLTGPSEAFAARHLLDRAGGTLSVARLDDARLIVTELVTNAVRHGQTGGPVDLVLRWDGQVLRVEVHSLGAFPRSFDIRAFAGAPTVEQTGGWGLRLVDALADRWGIQGVTETTVWAEVEARVDGAAGW
jgi:anti-sigma regulatory factor (Ser/Thr protein kinase)